MDAKTFHSVEIKNAGKGEVEALFSNFNVVDNDGDVTLPGAIQDGAPVRISAYGHKSWEGVMPVGRGVIRTTGTEAILQGRFFLNTTLGRDTFELVKEMGDLQEWSYGFDILPGAARQADFNGRRARILGPLEDGSPGLKVYEVSPVLLGAGIGTRTLATKSAVDDWARHPDVVKAAQLIAEWRAEEDVREQEAREYIRTLSLKLDRLQVAESFTLAARHHYIRTAPTDAKVDATAHHVAAACAESLGIPASRVPETKWFADATANDPLAWPMPLDIHGYWEERPSDDRDVVWVKAGRSLASTVNTVAHEVAHAAGMGHPDANWYGDQWEQAFRNAAN